MSNLAANALSSSGYESVAGYGGEAASQVFSPDVLLPSQFFSSGKAGVRGGERKLMAALLADGVEAYINHVTCPAWSEQPCDAVEWVNTKDYTYVFSFDIVCECLGIDPDYLRLGLARYVRAVNEKRISGSGGPTAWKKIRRPRKS